MKGTQHRIVCPQCGKVFFAWRPDDLPGAPVKCYLCGHQFEDEAARRKPATPPPAPNPETPSDASQPATAPPAANPETPPDSNPP